LVSLFGAVGDGVTDDTMSLKRAVAAVQVDGGVLEFESRTYRIHTIDNLGSAKPVVLHGSGATLMSDQEVALKFGSDSSDLTVEGLRIVTSSPAGEGVSGLVFAAGKKIMNLKIVNVEFSSPSCGTNGIKIDVGAVGSLLDGLEVSASRFNAVGRMGIEIINHTFDNVARFKNVRVSGNWFADLGRRARFGQAVSLSGFGRSNVIADNVVIGAKTIALEIVSASETTIRGNVVRGLQRGCSPLYVGRNAAFGRVAGLVIAENVFEGNAGLFQPTSMTGAVILNNIVRGTVKISVEASDHLSVSGNVFAVRNQVLWLSVVSSRFSENIFAASGDSAGYYAVFKDSVGNTVRHSTFKSERQFGLLVNGASTGNLFEDCVFSSEGSVRDGAALGFDGPQSTGNTVRGPRFRPRSQGGKAWVQSGNSKGNLVLER
jgi:hypothetical protein